MMSSTPLYIPYSTLSFGSRAFVRSTLRLACIYRAVCFTCLSLAGLAFGWAGRVGMD